MSGHTPGPWIIGGDGFEDQVFEKAAIPLDENGGFDPDADWGEALICEMGGNQANARLIAAAPSLLEALRYLTEEWIEDHEDETEPHDSACGVCFARAAIALAEGRAA